jgi:hypothetical protein
MELTHIQEAWLACMAGFTNNGGLAVGTGLQCVIESDRCNFFQDCSDGSDETDAGDNACVCSFLLVCLFVGGVSKAGESKTLPNTSPLFMVSVSSLAPVQRKV